MLKIMGKSQASIEQMRTYIKEVNPQVPDFVVKMIPLYIAEGTVEGVRGDIAFAQSCLETGDFTFSNSAVIFNQNNFCGLGVTKTGMKGNSFKTPAEGIRAQIQHLQAYASTDKLQNRCVDPRYTYTTEVVRNMSSISARMKTRRARAGHPDRTTARRSSTF